MYLDEHRHAERSRGRFEFAHAHDIKRGNDQQDAIGAHRARFKQLIRLEHEILAQHRQAACRARLSQALGAALKKLRIGQHRQAPRAMPGIACRDRRRIEILAQHAPARTRFLDLGNHRRFAGGDLRA